MEHHLAILIGSPDDFSSGVPSGLDTDSDQNRSRWHAAVRNGVARRGGPVSPLRCASSAVGWVRPSCEALVAAAIAAKAAKLPSYRRAASRVALLLVADSTRASGMLNWSDRDVVASPQGFDAVYFYRHPMAGDSGGVKGRPNIQMEPTRPPSRAIMSP